MSQIITPAAARTAPAASAYRVDPFRGERVGRVSSEWFSRPADQRFLSLADLHGSVNGRDERGSDLPVMDVTIMGRIVIGPAQMLPLDKLVASAASVRRIGAGMSLAELAEDIGRRGLLHSLSVRPVLDEAGAETGRYAVVAGGRRLAALQVLVRAKRLNKTAPVPCTVGRVEVAAEEDSLAENTMREALNPLDQFRAFQALREERGWVRRRSRLGSS